MTHGMLATSDRFEARRRPVATVLLADDNEHFRAGIARTLHRREDLDLIHEVSDGAQALHAIRELRPQVALVDARMPFVDGLMLTRAIRAEPALVTTSVVVLSARADEEFVEQALAAGAIGFIDKSQSRRDICDVVARIASPPPES